MQNFFFFSIGQWVVKWKKIQTANQKIVHSDFKKNMEIK